MLNIIKSPLLTNKFKMVRVQCTEFDDLNAVKDDIMDKMNAYLERNDG